MKKKYNVLLDAIKECSNYCAHELLFYALLDSNIIFFFNLNYVSSYMSFTQLNQLSFFILQEYINVQI